MSPEQSAPGASARTTVFAAVALPSSRLRFLPCIKRFGPLSARLRGIIPRRKRPAACCRVHRTTTASADFCTPVSHHCWRGSPLGRAHRSPKVSCLSFAQAPPDLPAWHPNENGASRSIARLPMPRRPCIRFLFVGSELPSSASFRFHLAMDTLAWTDGSAHYGP